ncbi:MAG: aldehyde dehydrogenase family protein, partial [Pseudoalteromonas sp.]
MSLITDISSQAAKAANQLALLDTETKNQVLRDMANALRAQKDFIIKENESDLAAARENDLASSMVDRLTLNDERIEAMAEGIEVIVSLEDPVGQLRDITDRPNGIKIRKMRVPLGVVCMIYEARPNVTADAGALCFKSGNGVILRGGKEALKSSQAIASVMHQVLEQHNLPTSLISVIPDPDRGLLMELMQQRDTIDLIIPRGGEGLINYVT